MALIAAHLNAKVILVVTSVAIGIIYFPVPPPPYPLLPVQALWSVLWTSRTMFTYLLTQTPGTGLRRPFADHCHSSCDYAISLEKLSQCQLTSMTVSVSTESHAQTAVSLKKTANIIPDVSVITDHIAYASTNKAQIV